MFLILPSKSLSSRGNPATACEALVHNNNYHSLRSVIAVVVYVSRSEFTGPKIADLVMADFC